MPTPLPVRLGDIVIVPKGKQHDLERTLRFQDARAAARLLESLELDWQTTVDIRAILKTVDPRANVSRLTDRELIKALADHAAEGRIVVGTRRKMLGSGGVSGDTASGASSAAAGSAAAAATSVSAASAESAAAASETAAAAAVSVAPVVEPAPPPSAETVAAVAAAEAAQADDATLNSELQAAVLEEAAVTGVPFCAECEKLAAKRRTSSSSASPTPTPPAAVSSPRAASAATSAPKAPASTTTAASAPPASVVSVVLAPPPPAPPEENTDIDAEAQAATLQRAAESGTPFCVECEKLRLEREAQAANA